MVSHQSRGTTGINSRSVGFLVYINDLPNRLISNRKLFADNASILFIVKDNLNSSNELNEDLLKTFQWTYHLEMLSNPGVSKQPQEVAFSHKKISIIIPLFSLIISQ